MNEKIKKILEKMYTKSFIQLNETDISILSGYYTLYQLRCSQRARKWFNAIREECLLRGLL